MNRLYLTLLALCIGVTACSQPTTSLPRAPGMTDGIAATFDRPVRYKLLYSFAGTDGEKPYGLTVVKNLLYGTTAEGGAHDQGALFVMNRSGGEQRVLYSFKGGDSGSTPHGVLAAYGAFYGTTEYGGTKSFGTVFKFDPSTGKFKMIYRFKGGTDGYRPLSGLIAANGVLYGTTARGGSDDCRQSNGAGCGTVFEVSTSGKERVLYRFRGNQDGERPRSDLLLHDGELFGTTAFGGGGGYCDDGCGTVYALSTSGKERVVHAFNGGSGGHEDGAHPEAALVAFKGLLYGTTLNGGGSDLCRDGCGTVFELSTTGKERILCKFDQGSDGAFLRAPLLVEGGTFYGTASGGGSDKNGDVFELDLAGKLRELYAFKGAPDGDLPVAPLVSGTGAAARRPFYGTTFFGGTGSCRHGCGTVFSISP
jgi:uncharacterized repeat protein (TIGR03803 family)